MHIRLGNKNSEIKFKFKLFIHFASQMKKKNLQPRQEKKEINCLNWKEGNEKTKAANYVS